VRDVSHEACELTQRGLEYYAHGRIREAVSAWLGAAQLAPHDPRARNLLVFARRKLNECDTPPATRSHRDTLESPIPTFLASLTVVEAAEGASQGSQMQRPMVSGTRSTRGACPTARSNERRIRPARMRGMRPTRASSGRFQNDKLLAGARAWWTSVTPPSRRAGPTTPLWRLR